LLSDKFGDVYRFRLSNDQQADEPELLLGHVSLITDMKVSPNGDRIVTSDRDFKLRSSFYPGCYEIDAFLLGHMNSVYTFEYVNQDRIVSGGADSFLISWNVSNVKKYKKIPIESTGGVKKIVTHLFNWIILSLDSDEVIVVDAQQESVKKTFKMPGKIIDGVAMMKEKSLFLGSDQGLYKVDIETEKMELIFEESDEFRLQDWKEYKKEVMMKKRKMEVVER
jgi:WD40 repeat protein